MGEEDDRRKVVLEAVHCSDAQSGKRVSPSLASLFFDKEDDLWAFPNDIQLALKRFNVILNIC